MTDFSEMASAFARPTTLKSGGYLSRLNAEEQAEVERFGEWLKGQMSDASRASYRSYLAAALVVFKSGGSRDDLTSSQKSAVTKYQAYLDALGKHTG